jgi:hypothetical protein
MLTRDIREVDGKSFTPIIYYDDTVVVGKYWLDIIHLGAKFVVVYTHSMEFHDKADVSPNKYWSIE